MRVWVSTWYTTKTYIGAAKGWEESGMNNKGMATKCVLWPAAKAEVLIYLNNCPLKKFPRERYNLEIMSWGLFLDGMDSQFWSKWFGWQECCLADLWYTQVLLWELKHRTWWLLTAYDSWVAFGEMLSAEEHCLTQAHTLSLGVSHIQRLIKHGAEYPAPFVSIWDAYDGPLQLPSPLRNCLRLLSQRCSSASPLLPHRS